MLEAARKRVRIAIFFPTEKERDFITGESRYLELSHVIGVGKVPATLNSALLILKLKPDVVILSGLAGAYPDCGLSIGDVVFAKSEFMVDECERGSSHISPLFGGFPAYSNFLQIEGLGRLGSFNTVSGVSGDENIARVYSEATGAICENMEGAAVAHVCYAFGVHLVEVRAISNVAGRKDTFRLKEPCRKLGKVIEEVIREIKSGNIHMPQ